MSQFASLQGVNQRTERDKQKTKKRKKERKREKGNPVLLEERAEGAPALPADRARRLRLEAHVERILLLPRLQTGAAPLAPRDLEVLDAHRAAELQDEHGDRVLSPHPAPPWIRWALSFVSPGVLLFPFINACGAEKDGDVSDPDEDLSKKK